MGVELFCPKDCNLECSFASTVAFRIMIEVDSLMERWIVLDFAQISKRLGDMWQTVPEKEKMVKCC